MKRNIFALDLLLITLLSLCVEATFVYAQSGQITLTATHDTYVNSGNSISNYGRQNYLEVKNYQYALGTLPYQDQSMVWLKFNLSSVPTGAIIDGATLQLYTSIVDETYTVRAYYCSDDSWTELGMTWMNKPTVGLITLDSTLVSSSNQLYTWNVSGAVSFAKTNNNLTAVTIVLMEPSLHTAFSSVWFNSKEASTPSADYSPKLTIHWSSIVPEFPAVVLLPFFIITTSLIAVLCKPKSKKISALGKSRMICPTTQLQSTR